jgi:hypothetical protein
VGVLGLMSHDNGPWVWPRERHQPFLAAVLRFWDEFDAVGPRYYFTGRTEGLWTMPTNLRYVLANMGVPIETLNAPLPPGGPAALLSAAHVEA